MGVWGGLLVGWWAFVLVDMWAGGQVLFGDATRAEPASHMQS